MNVCGIMVKWVSAGKPGMRVFIRNENVSARTLAERWVLMSLSPEGQETATYATVEIREVVQ